jgi:hypothetical protein
MALVNKTNVGFVTVAPDADPAESNFTCDAKSIVVADTSDATAYKITEIGWWCDTASNEANFEVGLYDDVGGVPTNLVFSSTVNAKGTTSGWKRVVVDWLINPSTTYWLGVQLDNTATTTNTNYVTSGGGGIDYNNSATTALIDPFDGGVVYDPNGMFGIYAVWITDPTSVTLSSPVGGESIVKGKEYNITWYSIGVIGLLTIELSINNGVDWSNIVVDTAAAFAGICF